MNDILAALSIRDVLMVLGGIGALYGLLRGVRRIVHLFDAMEQTSADISTAVSLVIHEFQVNGGRVTEPIVDEATARAATIKDVLLDLRHMSYAQLNIMHEFRKEFELHEERMEQRVYYPPGYVPHEDPDEK